MAIVSSQTMTSATAIATACLLRSVSRVRFWAGVAAVAAIVSFGVFDASTIQGSDGRALGQAVGIAFALRGMSMLPLVLPLVAGDLLAVDVRNGYVALQRSRGAGTHVVVWGHVLAHAGVAIVAGTVVVATGVVVGLAVLPGGVGTDPGQAFPFEPQLLATSPGAHELLMLGMYVFGAFALLVMATGVGAWSASGLAASLAAPVFVLAAGIFLPGNLQAVNPLERVMFANTWGAAWATPEGIATYWILAACIAAVVAVAGLKKREAAA